jgi:nitrogen fixation protein NifU and related proteins
MELYQELIIEHSKRPCGAGLREPFDAEVHHVNPTCGDEVTVRVHLSGDGQEAVLTDISFYALGCSISVASASIMAQQLTGGTLAVAAATHAAMRSMLTSRGSDPGDEDVLGDGVALSGVAKYPARVKCALLGWMALEDALAQTGHPLRVTSPSGPTHQEGSP